MIRFTLILIVFNFLFFNSFADQLNNCLNLSKFSTEYYKCKTDNFIKETKNYQKNEWNEEKKNLKQTKSKFNKIKKKILE
jgi:hypothetical protein